MLLVDRKTKKRAEIKATCREMRGFELRDEGRRVCFKGGGVEVKLVLGINGGYENMAVFFNSRAFF